MKHLLLYSILVGIPLAGLVAVLHFGRRLEPPRSIGGSWRVEREGTEGTRRFERLLSHESPAMTITQSGDRFELLPAGEAQEPVRGRLEGDVLRASLMSAGEGWIFSAKLGPGLDQMSGTISFVSTVTVVTPFTAERARGPRAKGE